MSSAHADRRAVRAGFTLVEALATLLILSAVGAGYMAALGASLRSSKSALWRTEASALAESRLNELRTLSAGELQRYVERDSTDVFPKPLDAMKWTVEADLLSEVPGVARAEVSVSGNGGTFVLVGLIAWPAADD